MNSINENESENMLIYDAEMCQYASLFDEIGHQLTRISNAYEDDIHDIEMCNLASVYDDLNQVMLLPLCVESFFGVKCLRWMGGLQSDYMQASNYQ